MKLEFLALYSVLVKKYLWKCFGINYSYFFHYSFSAAMLAILPFLLLLVPSSAFFQKLPNLPFLAPKTQSRVSPQETIEVILKRSQGKQNGIKTTADDKEAIMKAVKELEALNAVRDVAKSPKLDGKWNLVYTSNTGSSAGKLGPLVGQVVQDIDLSSGLYTNYAIFLNGLLEASLTATWDTLNAKTWRVNFQSLRFKLLGIQLLERELKSVGIWRMTYVDDSLRILYAQGTANPKNMTTLQENIYILKK